MTVGPRHSDLSACAGVRHGLDSFAEQNNMEVGAGFVSEKLPLGQEEDEAGCSPCLACLVWFQANISECIRLWSLIPSGDGRLPVVLLTIRLEKPETCLLYGEACTALLRTRSQMQTVQRVDTVRGVNSTLQLGWGGGHCVSSLPLPPS